MHRSITWILMLAFSIISLFPACSGDASKITINIPVNGRGNPFNELLSYPYSGLYFKFLELQSSYSSLYEVTDTVVWYPDPSEKGVNPEMRDFDLGQANLLEGTSYRVELYGKNDYQEQDYTYYGYPDCPLIVGAGSENLVNICFGYTQDELPLCSGMAAFGDCFR